jgi:hypothetical protein
MALLTLMMARIAQSVQRLATSWTVRGSNPDRGEIFRTRPERPWGPPSLLHNGYRFFPGDKAAGAWPSPPTPSSAEVKEIVELYPGFDPRRYQIFWVVVGLERGPLSLVRSNEELLE